MTNNIEKLVEMASENIPESVRLERGQRSERESRRG